MQHKVCVGAGVIDPDYTGEIKALLINDGKHYYQVNQGDPIAQLILEKASIPTTGRGERGCGSHSQNISSKSEYI